MKKIIKKNQNKLSMSPHGRQAQLKIKIKIQKHNKITNYLRHVTLTIIGGEKKQHMKIVDNPSQFATQERELWQKL